MIRNTSWLVPKILWEIKSISCCTTSQSTKGSRWCIISAGFYPISILFLMATDSMMPRGVRDASEFDCRLQHPFSCVISGPSNSGKTYFVKCLMENGLNMILKKFENIVYIYNCWQPLYDELLKLYDIKFVEGIPTSLNDDHLLPVNKAYLLILDDMMSEASGNAQVQKVFTQFVHHRNLSSIYIIQNLFAQGKSSRTISLNTNYLILFKKTQTLIKWWCWGSKCIRPMWNTLWSVIKTLPANLTDTSWLTIKRKCPNSTGSERGCFPIAKWSTSRKEECEHSSCPPNFVNTYLC